MHRSSSTTRVSDDFSSKFSSSSSSSSSPSQSTNSRTFIDNTNHNGTGVNQLPVYNPNSPAAKKERSRLRTAENAVHVIPLVLVLCAIILWFCSNPDIAVDVVKKSDSAAARVEGLKVAGAVEVDGTQNSLLAHLELEDIDLAGHTIARKPSG
ncbi:hypothetical protein Ancab_015994 [Ancistrocladus abbreviatus]